MALGFMRSNVLLTTTSMFVGKLVRYIFVVYCMLYAVDGFLSMIHNL